MKMNYRRHITAITFFSPLFLAMTVTPGMATENGTPSTAAGTYDFGAGFLPHTTDLGTFGSRVAYYSAHANLDNAGNKKKCPVLSASTHYEPGLAEDDRSNAIRRALRFWCDSTVFQNGHGHGRTNTGWSIITQQ
ncbi:hypothetical protein [Dickeya oryzae]